MMDVQKKKTSGRMRPCNPTTKKQTDYLDEWYWITFTSMTQEKAKNAHRTQLEYYARYDSGNIDRKKCDQARPSGREE
jgi:hypothetical protein